LTNETLIIACLGVGLTAADMDLFDIGQLLDISTTYNNLCSEENENLDFKYQQLKDFEGLYREKHAKGEISDADYSGYLEALKEGEKYA
jgi:hypothetical protein